MRELARRTTRALVRLAIGILWLLAATAIALGGAGLAASLDHRPGTTARTELTWANDLAVEPGLAAARDDLTAIEADLELLGEVGRAALASLIARDTSTLAILIEQGDGLIAEIEQASGEVRLTIRELPGTGPGEEIRLSAAVLDRRTAIEGAVAATRGISGAWAQLEGGALTATRLTLLLEDHDAAVVAATGDGRRQRYRPALRHLDRADALMADMLELRTTLENTIDVATLNEWLSRARAYDKALRRLYAALQTSAGRVNREVREAFAEERAARDRLPPSTRNLVIIMNDIAQGGVNDAVIAIELARGRLQAALEAPAEPSAGAPGED